MEGKPDKLEKIKEKINLKFNIQGYGKAKNFLGVYYEWGHDTKGLYAKMTTKEDARKLVEGYEKHTRSYVTVQENPGAPGTTISKSYLEEPQDMINIGHSRDS